MRCGPLPEAATSRLPDPCLLAADPAPDGPAPGITSRGLTWQAAAPGGILAIMAELILKPSRVTAAGQPPKLIDEYIGRASTGQAGLSIAHMRSPSGWAEPGQRPEFDEFTIVLRGALVVRSEDGQMTVRAGQAVHTRPGEGVRYSPPGADGADYISVCLPAFAPDTVHRDD